MSSSNKMLCFSRTTSFIFDKLPDEFFDFDSDKAKFDKQKKLEMVFPQLSQDDMSSMCILQVRPNTSCTKILGKIKKFLSMDNYGVMLFLVNMLEISKDTVNYLRLIIEEAEFEKKERKQFIILLHFPGDQFFLHCYPAYFLEGWDLTYLDSIAPSSTTQRVLDLKSCFYYAYKIPESSVDFMSRVVQSFLSSDFASFSLARIRTIFHEYEPPGSLASLLSLDSDQSIGSGLTSKFCHHWSPVKMMQTLQQASNSSLCLDYTLNMTDAISTIIRSNFYDFMHYMLTLLVRHGILSILHSASPIVFELILCQIKSTDIPVSSTEMKLSAGTIGHKSFTTPLHFPFFHNVYHAVENSLKQNRPVSKSSNDNFIKKFEKELKEQVQHFFNVFFVCFTIYY